MVDLITPSPRGLLTFIRVGSILLLFPSCTERFTPDLVQVDNETRDFYEADAARNLGAMMQHCVPCQFDSEFEKRNCERAFESRLEWGKPRLLSCDFESFERYSQSGRVMRGYCTVIRRKKKYVEIFWISAIYPSLQPDCHKKFRFIKASRREEKNE